MRFADLLAQENVDEHCELRSSKLGFMAYHGGQLEKVTDIVAHNAARSSGMSYYGVLQTDEDSVVHLPSATVSPDDSPQLAKFLGHVDTVITVHGYGRKRLWHSLLLGGRNRDLADHVNGWFDGVTIADLVKRGEEIGLPRAGAGQPMYFI